MRPPNLATASADVLAGFAAAGLAAPQKLPWLLLATTALYAGGVVLNDVFDARLDALERPERPIPSGRVTRRAAGVFGGVLLAAGVATAVIASPYSGAVAALIAACALLYDAWGKHRPVTGAVNMGSCRGLNLLLGLSAAPGLFAHRWALALIPLAYVAAITAVSQGEVHGGKRRSGLAALALVAAVTAVLLAMAPLQSWMVLPFLAVFAWRVLPPFWRAFRRPEPGVVRAAVRAGVLGLIPLDATIAAGYAGLVFGLAVLALLALAGALARLFAVA
jgi:4-hydroxybenzoate polyprenyltransferase